MKEILEKIKGKFVDLHVHDLSDKDAHIEPKKIIKKLNSLGRKGMASTNHGVLSTIEDLRRVFKENELKFVPGVELYVDGGIAGRQHLVLLAKNDNGYFKGVSKVVTASNYNVQNGFPVISEEKLFGILEPVKNDVYVLSGCMQGVLCSVLLQNDKVNKEIKKLEMKASSYIDAEAPIYKNLLNNLEEAEKTVSELKATKDTLTVVANQRFAKREKEVAKAEAQKLEEAKTLREKLEADKIAANDAAKKLEEIKVSLKKAEKILSSYKASKKDADIIIEKHDNITLEIEELKKELKNPIELYKKASAKAKTYKEFFGPNFYIEVQNHGIPAEKECFMDVIKIAKELSIPLVATNDVHTLDNSKEELLKRQILRSLRFGKWEEESVGDSELYFKSEEEMVKALLDLGMNKEDIIEAINNTSVIFDSCDVAFAYDKYFPRYKNAEKELVDSKALLDEEVAVGIKNRFPHGFPKGKEEEYQKRLDYELEIIKSMGYADYHLIVKDYIEYGKLLGYVPAEFIEEAPLTIEELRAFIKEHGWKNPGMVIGPGRGSAAGSLVCYSLGITNLDPIKYGLLFERFLNPERVSMPDIDVDFANRIRQKCIQFLKNKYGEKAICGILTKNAQAPKGCVRICARFYGLKTYGEELTSLGDSIAKAITKEVGVSFSSKVNEKTGKLDNESSVTLVEFLRKNFAHNTDALTIIEWAVIIEGLFTSYGSHAAGIGLSNSDDISDYIPLKANTELGMMTTQCDMIQFEENGLLKFDFLGLKTLDVITDATRLIYRNHGTILDLLNIDFEDRVIFDEIFSKGNTTSVFQFESNGMKNMLKRFKPTCFEDLIVLVSMFRPGPLQFIDDVIEVKNGRKPVTYLCPELEPILGPTYGAMVYQEQVMKICTDLAGFSMAHADNVRKYMSKKKADKLAHEEPLFIDGCVANGIDAEIAKILFGQMMDFAKYAFNKSHAACYAFVAYITAWIKYYYPAEFFAAALNWADTSKYPLLMGEAKNMGVSVIAPSVNNSIKEFTTVDGKIAFGLGVIKGVAKLGSEIELKREEGTYTSILDFIKRVRPDFGAFKALTNAGALDEFSSNRLSIIKYFEDTVDILKKIREKESFIASAKAVLPIIDTNAEKIINTQVELNLKIEIKEVSTKEKLEKRISNAENALRKLEEELSDVSLTPINEDKKEKMAEEYALLGAYVSMHPMDIYPSVEELGLRTISDGLKEVIGSRTEIYGIAKDIRITSRKSDGAKMAFFVVSDKTNEVEACVFTKAYASLRTPIEEGQAYIMTGKFMQKDDDYLDDDEIVYQFIIESMKLIEEKKSSYLLEVSSYASFHLDIESIFMEEYEDVNGHPLYIYDKTMKEMRLASYKVSDRCIKVCQELKI